MVRKDKDGKDEWYIGITFINLMRNDAFFPYCSAKALLDRPTCSNEWEYGWDRYLYHNAVKNGIVFE